MGVALSATVFIWFAQGLAFLLLPWSLPLAARVRAVLFWAIATPILFGLRDPLAALLLIGLILFFVAPFSAVERAAFFLVAVPVVPVFVSAPLPFPGVNYLIDLTHYKMAALMLLPLALLIGGGGERRGRAFGATDAALLLYVIYTAAIVGSATNTTSGVRFFIDHVLIFLLPYVAFHVLLREQKDVDAIFKAFLVASVLLAAVALVSFAKRWDIYGILNPNPFTEYRDGRPRVDATMNTHSLGFHLAAGILVLEYLKHRISIGWLWLNGLRVFLLAGMVPTDSRGAFAGLLVALGSYVLLMRKSTAVKVAMILAGIMGLIGVVIWLAEGNVAEVDAHGTFAYRQALLWTSLEYIGRYPLFGDLNFRESGAFDHLVTGLGIVDITNLYLLVALNYGLVGFALLFFVFVGPLLRLAPRLVATAPTAANTPAEREAGYATWHRASAVSVSVLVGWLFLVATTSDVGLTMHIGIVFAAICTGLRAMRPIVERARDRLRPSPRPRENALAT